MADDALRVTRWVGRGGSRIKLSGAIDDSFDLRVFDGLEGFVVLDLEGITRVTSFGVRSWLAALKLLRADRYYFVRCRPTVVAQFNMVAGFAGDGTMVSFFAPYHCAACDKDFEILVDLRIQHELVAGLRAPAAGCPACGAEAELDDLPEAFFSFAASSPKPYVEPAAVPLLDSAVPVPFKAKKSIEGSVTLIELSGMIEKAASFKRLGDGLEGTVVIDLSHVLGVTALGAAAFGAFLGLDKVSIYLAGVPLAIAGELAGVPEVRDRARVCSISVGGSCVKCRNERTVELDPTAWALVREHQDPSIPCPECGEPLHLEISIAAVANARALQLVADPAVHERVQDARRPRSGRRTTEIAMESFGKYQLVKRLGAGGMAEVFLARQVGPMGFDRNVVLKRILPHLSTNKEFVAMFLQEARVAAKLSHPNIVQVFELGAENGQYFMALEYVRGWDLHQILRAAQLHQLAMPVGIACRIVASVCAGLHAAHANTEADDEPREAIVHRDVTPHNILVSVGGNVKLSDFGIAKVATVVTQTEPGVLKGKLPYVAPEVISEQPLDARADIYAAGLVLYECLTFANPFKRDDQAATLRAVIDGDMPPLATVRPDAPPALQQVIALATARVPDHRFPTAEQMQHALEEVLGAMGQVVTAKEVAEWLRIVAQQATPGSDGERSLTPLGLTPTGDAVLATKKERI